MLLTSADANKRLRKLNEEMNALELMESKSAVFRCRQPCRPNGRTEYTDAGSIPAMADKIRFVLRRRKGAEVCQ